MFVLEAHPTDPRILLSAGALHYLIIMPRFPFKPMQNDPKMLYNIGSFTGCTCSLTNTPKSNSKVHCIYNNLANLKFSLSECEMVNTVSLWKSYSNFLVTK